MIKKWNNVHKIATRFLESNSNHEWYDLHVDSKFGSNFCKVCKKCGLVAKHHLYKSNRYKTLKDHKWCFYLNDCYIANLKIGYSLLITCSDVMYSKMDQALE